MKRQRSFLKNKQNKTAKAILELLKNLPFMKIKKRESDLEYDLDFVKKILDSDKNDKRIRIHSDNIWDSI